MVVNHVLQQMNHKRVIPITVQVSIYNSLMFNRSLFHERYTGETKVKIVFSTSNFLKTYNYVYVVIPMTLLIKNCLSIHGHSMFSIIY